MATHTRNVRKRPSPSLPSKDGKVSSSSSSSWWDSPLTQQHALSDNSRFSPSRARSPPSVLRHHHSHSHYNQHQRQRSSTPFSPSSSSSLTAVFSSAVLGSRAQPSGGDAAAETATASTATSGGGRPGCPSPTSPFPFATASSFSSTPTSSSSLPTSSSTSSSSSVQQEEARQRFFDRRNKRHVNLRAMKERAVNGDRETMEYVEYQSAMSPSSSSSLRDRIRRGCWTAVDQDQNFDMDMLPPYYHRSELEHERARNYHEYDGECVDTFGLYDQGEGEDEVPMDVDVGYGGSGSGSRSAGGTDEYIYCNSTIPTPIPTTTTMANKSLSSPPSSSALSYPLPATFPTISPHHQHLMSNADSSTPFQGPYLLSSSPSSSLASCSSSYSSACADRNWSMLPTERENESTFGATPLGISVPVIEANTNNSSSNSGNSGSGIERWHGNGSGSVRGGSGGASSTPSSPWRRMVVPPSSLSASSTPSFLFGSQGSLMRLPRRNSQGTPQQQLLLSRNFSASAVFTSNNNASATTSSSASSASTMTVATETPTTTTTGAPQKMQQILNRQDKIAFLTKYTDRMHLRLQVLGIEDWGQGDIQRKKTYQLMIQHNDKTGEKDLVKFYLGRYGGSVTSSSTDVGAVTEPVAGVELVGLPLQQEQGQGQGQQQQGTPVVVQA
ncbi:MAG: hypothetical protein J3R72DRAFT_418875 [Linnemannia gamsii]|nr:MAG: hypothetical protein J3R72DRAFT_418875 [Linnemannia gamsii]